jgi:hypothetical protein
MSKHGVRITTTSNKVQSNSTKDPKEKEVMNQLKTETLIQTSAVDFRVPTSKLGLMRRITTALNKEQLANVWVTLAQRDPPNMAVLKLLARKAVKPTSLPTLTSTMMLLSQNVPSKNSPKLTKDSLTPHKALLKSNALKKLWPRREANLLLVSKGNLLLPILMALELSP